VEDGVFGAVATAADVVKGIGNNKG
jgi:hypothetical protein